VSKQIVETIRTLCVALMPIVVFSGIGIDIIQSIKNGKVLIGPGIITGLSLSIAFLLLYYLTGIIMKRNNY
jgi:hypothetical protein